MFTSISIFQIVFDIIVLAILFTVQQILTSNLISPFQESGFYCNDYSVNYDFKKSTVTNLHLILLSLVFPLIVICLAELIRTIVFHRKLKNKNYQSSFKLMISKEKSLIIPEQIGNIYVNIGYFLFGLLATNLITNTGKLTIGRLRPNFLSVCKPNIGNPYSNLCSSLSKTYLIPGRDFTCNETNLKEVLDAKKSFPSGHSSLSFYSMVFLALFINHIWNFYITGKLFPKVIQVGLVSFAFFVALSRSTDNKHHPTDILTGSLIGIICAIITFVYLHDFLNRKNYKLGYELIKKNMITEEEIKNNTEIKNNNQVSVTMNTISSI